MSPSLSTSPRARSLAALASLWLSSFCASGIDIHLQPNGNSGQLAATLQSIREARKAGDTSPANVHLATGDYPLESALVLEPQDSHISFAAEPGAHPRISGGKRISGIQVGSDGIWTVKLDPKWKFEAL